MSYNPFNNRSSFGGPSGSNTPGGGRPYRDFGSVGSPLSTGHSSQSGSFRGNRGQRGGRGQWGNLNRTGQNRPDARPLLDGLSTTKPQDVDASSLKLPSGEVKIKDVKVLGSYNWVDDDDPTIMVPGSPAVWLDKKPPFSVEPDTGAVIIDQGGHHLPRARMLPLIVAVEKQAEETGDPPFDWAAQDILTDRNNLRKLISWSSNPTNVKDFRIDMQLAGEHTVLMNRWEASMQDVMPGFTYGHNFEKVATQRPEECKDTHSHHRIIQYDLNGLKMVVRFEVDGFLPDKSAAIRKPVKKPTASSVDDLANALSQVKIDASEKVAGLKVVKGGTLVPQSNILEVTTKSKRGKAPIDYQRIYAQMVVSNTPNLCIAMHNSGIFEEIKKETLNSPIFMEQHRTMQPALKKFRALLTYIQQQVVKHGQQGCLSLVCQGGVLKLYSRTVANDFLPEEYMAKFDA